MPEEYPEYVWERTGVDEFAAPLTATLCRQTKTKRKPVFMAAGGEQPRRFFDENRTVGPIAEAEGGFDEVPVRGEFLAAVKASFVRGGGSPWTREELLSLDEELEWYEEAIVEALRDAEGPAPPEETESPMPGEAWDLVSHARSEITLSDYIGDTSDSTDEEAEPETHTPLDQFAGGDGGEQS